MAQIRISELPPTDILDGTEYMPLVQENTTRKIVVDRILDLGNNRFADIAHGHSDYALVGHDHDDVYALLSHNHDGVYAIVDHNHDADYSAVGHSHSYASPGHLHDDDYVNVGGDTMLDVLVNNNRWRTEKSHAGGNQAHQEFVDTDSGSDFRWILRGADSPPSMALWSGVTSNYLFKSYENGEFVIHGDFNVSGAKNAQILLADDPTKALRFAATESNTPGIMEVYCGVHSVGSGRERTLRQEDFEGLVDEVRLAEYVKIGRSPRVYVQPAGPREDNQPHAPYAWAEWDPDDPRIELRAPAGDYHVELRFIRADAGVANWAHQVDVSPEEEPV